MLVPICIIIMLMQINKLLSKCGYEDICETRMFGGNPILPEPIIWKKSKWKSGNGLWFGHCEVWFIFFGFLFLLFCWEFYAMKTLGLSIFHFHVLIFFSCLVSIPLYRVIKSLFLFCDSHFVCFFFTLCIFTGLTLFGFVLISFSCVLLPWYFHC